MGSEFGLSIWKLLYTGQIKYKVLYIAQEIIVTLL